MRNNEMYYEGNVSHVMSENVWIRALFSVQQLNFHMAWGGILNQMFFIHMHLPIIIIQEWEKV